MYKVLNIVYMIKGYLMIVVNIYLLFDRIGKYFVFVIIIIMINLNLIVCMKLIKYIWCIVFFVLFFFCN